MEFVTTCNTYIEMSAPWKLAKDPGRAEALDHVLFVLTESLRIIGVLISPVLPTPAREIFFQLNVPDEYKLSDAIWGGLPERHHLGKPTPLFPRIES
jgi:methionyl-tRNA synthetase